MEDNCEFEMKRKIIPSSSKSVSDIAVSSIDSGSTCSYFS